MRWEKRTLYNRPIMHRFVKRLFWLATTLGLGALAYALMRNEGERVMRFVSREGRGEGEPPGSRAEAGPAQCAAFTKSGERCVREAQPGSDFCWQHA